LAKSLRLRPFRYPADGRIGRLQVFTAAALALVVASALNVAVGAPAAATGGIGSGGRKLLHG
jgi:hypothetical protein